MRHLILTLLVSVLFGCSHDRAPVENSTVYGVTVFTDKTDYIRNEKTIITIYNNTNESVVFQGCLSNVYYYRDKWVEDQWVQWTSLVCPDSLMEEMTIDPYTNMSDSLVVHKPGTYRFRYPLFWNGDINDPDTITSNSFTIH
ncbi:hypothetical protein F9K33_07310 [bacterium]|nr:MAG: hypothetical protein F9K33_07310 [bacterium]